MVTITTVTSERDQSSRCEEDEYIKEFSGNYRIKVSGNLIIMRSTEKGWSGTNIRGNLGDRGKITEFTDSSRSRMLKYLRECCPTYTHMVTLTYPGFFPSDGREVKNHLRKFIQELKRYDFRNSISSEVSSSFTAGDSGFSVFWFMEFQSRGAPHFHLLVNRFVPKDWTARRWYEIVNSEDQRHLRAGTRCEEITAGRAGISSYAAKYAAKNAQKVIPAGYEDAGRFWGVCGEKSCVSAATIFDGRLRTLDVRYNDKINRFIVNLRGLAKRRKLEVIKKEDGIIILSLSTVESQQTMRWLVAEMEYHRLLALGMNFAHQFECEDLFKFGELGGM